MWRRCPTFLLTLHPRSLACMAAWRELWDVVVDVHCSWRENLVERNVGEGQFSGFFSEYQLSRCDFEASSAAPHAPQSTSTVHCPLLTFPIHPARPSEVLTHRSRKSRSHDAPCLPPPMDGVAKHVSLFASSPGSIYARLLAVTHPGFTRLVSSWPP